MAQTATVIDPGLDTIVGTIVRTIAEGFHPNRIILFGSRARGDALPDSDYDMAVELAGDREELRSAISSALDEFDASVDIVVRAPGELEALMHDVGWVDYDIGREGIVIYADGVGPMRQHLRAVLRVREGAGRPPASVATWLERADEDLLIIRNLMKADVVPWSGVCFHAQQAAEKYLKVLLIQRNIRPTQSHNLSTLLQAARRAGYVVPGLDRDCKFLKKFAVGARYPENMAIPREATGRRSADAVRRIIDVVKPLVTPQPPMTQADSASRATESD